MEIIFDKFDQPFFSENSIFGTENPWVLISARVTSFFIELLGYLESAILFLKISTSNLDSLAPKTH